MTKRLQYWGFFENSANFKNTNFGNVFGQLLLRVRSLKVSFRKEIYVTYVYFKFPESLNSYFLEFLLFFISKNVPAN